MSTDANKLERIQQRFAALCFNHFFPGAHYFYSLALEELKLHTLHISSSNSIISIELFIFTHLLNSYQIYL
jgi:hypothetical protein